MIISVTGGNKQHQKLAESMACFAAEKLMSPRMLRVITVDIELTKDLINEELSQADCTWQDNVYRPREFIIRIDASLSKRSLLESVAHEMVHVKQYATGELREYATNSDLSKFLGVLYKHSKTDYYELPWEIEAYGREVGLCQRWLEFTGNTNEKWAQNSY